ncbi:MAG TPA: ATP-dependent DNA helicase RecG [Sedimentisphaerales bacterium]|nr:ATP-dependent DNA helicase RecG [Sedimentisphaerales bacterium]
MTGDFDNSGNQYSLAMPVQYLKGVGPAKAKVFEGIGIHTVGDLLEYYPRDWRFVDEPVKIKELRVGQKATLVVLIESTDYQGYRKGAMFEVMTADDTGMLRLLWFNGGYLTKQLEPGMVIMICGKVTEYKHQMQMSNPKFTVVEEEDNENPTEYFSGGVYRSCGKLSSGQIKKIIEPLLEHAEELMAEFYDDEFRKDAELIRRADAFKWIHKPEDEEQLRKAKRRLKYDELFLMQLGLALRRYRMRHYSAASVMGYSDKIDSRIRRRFPFLLTEGQNDAISDIVADMGKSEPMNRLLQGDVGSGKTVVALYAALLAIANKRQVAFMAPTEILAEQHFLSIERYLKGTDVKRALVTGGFTGKKRDELLGQIKEGDIDIVVGTVALLQKDIEFKSLGLVIIDEQHKFGVEQRSDLRKDGAPHCLVMTATPIPRTLAMTAFGDLDVSIIKFKPPGRGEVVTRLVDRKDQGKAEEFIRERLKAGKQAYFVYPRIANMEGDVSIRAATDEWEKLSKKVFPEFEVALLHGRMTSQEKKQIMDGFRKGKINVLVSTVVIEVGVDVPNATIMVIEDANHFGLAQLHQLRGRIGRGQAKSFCFLFADTDDEEAQSRLAVMARSNDGFEIAEHDLKLRGPGELFSTRQHGLPDMKIANIIDDYELLVMARKNAFKFVEKDPMLRNSENKAILKEIISKFGDSLGLADIA